MSEPQASPEDFKLDKGYEPLASKTLEEVISEGESPEERENKSERITVNNFAQWLRSVGIHLKHRHKNATNVSVIEHSMIKIGIAIVRQKYNALIHQIQSLKESIFEAGNQIHLMKAYSTSYQPQETVGTIYHKVSIREWEMGALTELLVEPLGLPFSTAILLVVALAVALGVVPAASVGANSVPQLVGLWHFDEGSGTDAYDSSGNGNDGTITNATWAGSGNGMFGDALSFVGLNDYVEVGDASELRFGDGDSITIEAWVQPAAATALGVIVQKGGITDHNTNYVLRQAGKKVDFFYRGIDNAWHGFRTNADVLTPLAWAHVAVTYTFGTPASIKIYVNGISYAVSGTWPGSADPMGNDQTLRFGGLNYWGQKYYGLIDEVRIWDEALTAGQIGDVSAPVVSITAPAAGCYTSASLPSLAYTIDDANSYVGAVTGWLTDEATHTVTVTATDVLGYVGSDSVTYTVDNTDPVVTITAPEDGAFYLVGMVPAPDYTVTDNLDLNPTVVEDPAWSDTAGMHTYTVTATDCAGNVGSDSVTYYVVDSYGTIGGKITEEDVPKKKDWVKITYGGWAGLDGTTEYGALEVTFHNVNNDDLDKTKFVADSIDSVQFTNTGWDPDEDEVPTPPYSDCNKVIIWATGYLVDTKTLQVVSADCEIKIQAVDTGEPGHPATAGSPDSIRIELMETDGGMYDYDSSQYGDGDFDWYGSSADASGYRHYIDAGNIQVVSVD